MAVTWVASGGVTTTSAVVHAAIDTTESLQVSTDPGLVGATSVSGTETTTGVWRYEISGLAANTVYHYGVDGTPHGRFRTAPTGPASFLFTAGACLKVPGYSDDVAYDDASLVAMTARNPAFFMSMGDMPYSDIDTNEVQRYRDAWAAVHAASGFSELAEIIPIAYVWDDHDYSPNNGDGTHIGKPAAQQAYREMWPSYPLPSVAEIYHTFVWGRVRFIMLDVRSEKSPRANTDNSSKTMLGADQKAWFKSTLLAATEPVIVVNVSVPWIGTDTGDDWWGGYTTERTELHDFFVANDLMSRIVLIHGDMHSVAADDGTNSGGLPLFAFAPLNNANSVKGGPYTVGPFESSQTQYGSIEFDDDGVDIRIAGRGYRADTDSELFVLSFTVEGAEWGAWSAFVASTDPGGVTWGEWSATSFGAWSPSVVTVPAAVDDLAGVAGDGQVVLTWSAPDDGGASITDYVVQYRVVA